MPSCSGDREGKDAAEAERIARTLEASFSDIIKRNDSLGRELKALYSDRSTAGAPSTDLSTGAVVKHEYPGGRAYYEPNDDGGCSIFVSGEPPITEDTVRVMCLIESAEQRLIEARAGLRCAGIVGIYTKESICLEYPWRDALELDPVGVDIHFLRSIFDVMDYPRHPDKSPAWGDPDAPMLELTLDGRLRLTLARAFPIYAGPRNEMDALAVINADFTAMARDAIGKSETAVLLVSKNLALVGASGAAVDDLGLSLIEDKPLALAEYAFQCADLRNFGDSPASPDLAGIARGIESGSAFDCRVEGRSYRVHVARTKDPLIFVVALTRRRG